jgi:hypothetical protein
MFQTSQVHCGFFDVPLPPPLEKSKLCNFTVIQIPLQAVSISASHYFFAE